MLARIVNYFREARAELARVTWPSRDEIIQATEAVLLFTFFMMVILWLYDVIFGWAVGVILRFLR
jgi:preprotein translocase subunit SecE